ncbi:unnamed protein product [Caenorhabditis nigoni]
MSHLRSVQESKPQVYIFWQTLTVVVVKMSLHFLNMFITQWLNGNCPEWQTAPLQLVNAHLWLHGPQEVNHVNGKMEYGILQMSNAK